LSPKIGNSSRDVDKRLRIKGLHLDGLGKVLRAQTTNNSSKERMLARSRSTQPGRQAYRFAREAFNGLISTRGSQIRQSIMNKGLVSVALILVLLSSSGMAAAEDMTTRFGQLSINDKRMLLFKGHPLDPGIQGNNSLNFVKKFSMGGTDVILLEDDGGSACTELYYLVSVTAEGARPTPEFGSCGELLNVAQQGDAILVTTRGYMGPFEPKAARAKAAKEKHVFTIRAGVVTEHGKPVR
jgi:hypothetical protein